MKQSSRWLVSASAAFSLLATGHAHADTTATPKVIYGTDDRIDVYQETNPDRLAWAAATCGIVSNGELTDNGNGTFTVQASAFTYAGRQPCEGEPFGTQLVAPYCSAFLVGEDLIATAGHCVQSGTQLNSVKFIFGFQMTSATDEVLTLGADQVYTGIDLVGHQYDSQFDYSVVQLDRPVTAPGALPLPLRRSGVVPIGANIGVIGHPTGLPLKISFGPTTTVHENTNAGFFVANLDTYGGNSGSPVINAANGLVEGILVRGEKDYNITGQCFSSNRIADSAAGEEVSKSVTFASFVPEVLPEGEGALDGEGSPTHAFHTADKNHDRKIDLSELLRVVQLYNADAFHCESTSEDGFAIGAGNQACAHHDSDYLVVDFVLQLNEVLRLVQIFNSVGYTACDAGEDGFCV